MKRILIAVPTFETISPDTFKSIYNLKKSQGVKIDFDFVRGYDCARARNVIANKAIEGEYDYILMVDSDVILPKNTIESMSQYDYPLILGYSPRKDNPVYSEIYKIGAGYPKENRFLMSELISSDTELIKINGGSFGCAFIKTDIFSQLSYPYFAYVNYSDGQLLSEDLYFCSELRKVDRRIYVNTNVKCKHIARKIIE